MEWVKVGENIGLAGRIVDSGGEGLRLWGELMVGPTWDGYGTVAASFLVVIIQDSSHFASIPQRFSTLRSTGTAGVGMHSGGDDERSTHRRRPDIFVGLTESSSKSKGAVDRFNSRMEPGHAGHRLNPNHVDLHREEMRLGLEIERLRSQRAVIFREIDGLEFQLQRREAELSELRAQARAAGERDRPVLYAIAPVGEPTARAATPEVQQVIQITLQHRVAGMHGNMIDVFG